MIRTAKRFSIVGWFDGFLINNPVISRGLMIAPIIGCKDLQSAAAISIAAAVIGIPTLVFSAFLKEKIPSWIRNALCAILSAALYIPAAMLVDTLFGVTLRTTIGIYLPLVIMSSMVTYKAEYSKYSSNPIMILREGFINTVGFAFCAFIIGILRQLLGTGYIFGKLLITNPLIVFTLPSGGIILVAFLCGFWNCITMSISKMAQSSSAKEVM